MNSRRSLVDRRVLSARRYERSDGAEIVRILDERMSSKRFDPHPSDDKPLIHPVPYHLQFACG